MNWKDYEVDRRVVCVSDYSGSRKFLTIMPEKGRVYTIKAVSVGLNADCIETLGLRFQEFESFPPRGCGVEARDGFWWFPAKDFRPLDESRLDQFRQLLKSTPWKLETVS